MSCSIDETDGRYWIMAMIPPVPSADVPIPSESGTIVTLELLADDVLAEGTVVNASIEDISFRTWYADRSGEDANLQSSVNFKITIGAPTVADAVLDRIVHSSHRIELTGESIRKMNAKK